MADIAQDSRLVDENLHAHQQTFQSFNKLVLFAILHVALVLGSLALAFLGHAPVFATLVGIGGTVALLALFVIT